MKDTTRPAIIKPGLFGQAVAADNRRGVFDAHNEQLLAQETPIAAVFAGDSITEGWALDAFFRGNGGIIVNRGIGGDTTPYFRRRFPADVVQLRPQLAVILIGINNTWELDQWVSPEMLRSPTEITAEISGDIAAVVAEAQGAGITVALGSILPTDIPSLRSNQIRNELVAGTNQRLREMAANQGIIYVDYHSAMVQPDGLTLRPGLADDGLHPHILGYRLMAGVLLETLEHAGVKAVLPSQIRP